MIFLSYFPSGESRFVSPKYTKLKKKSLEEFTIRFWIVAENKLGESLSQNTVQVRTTKQLSLLTSLLAHNDVSSSRINIIEGRGVKNSLCSSVIYLLASYDILTIRKSQATICHIQQYKTKSFPGGEGRLSHCVREFEFLNLVLETPIEWDIVPVCLPMEIFLSPKYRHNCLMESRDVTGTQLNSNEG